MKQPAADDDDWGEEWDDADDADAESSDDEPTIACPYCRREIHEESLKCPYCDHYLSAEDAPPSPKPWWIVIGVGLGLYAVYRWIVG